MSSSVWQKPMHLLPIGDHKPICGTDPEATPFFFTFHWVNVTCDDCLKQKPNAPEAGGKTE